MRVRLGKIQLRIHGVMPLLWLFTCIVGTGRGLIPAFLALALHEAGHLLAAKVLQMRVESVEITPYGGVISIENMEYATPWCGFVLAAAGPVFSILGCCLAMQLLHTGWIDFSFVQQFFRGNLILCILNLLPALPLDGGRMLRALLSRSLPYARVTRVLTTIGNILGVTLCVLSVIFALRGILNFSPAFAGIYLLYAAAVESRQATTRYISALISRRQRMENDEILPVEIIAAGGETKALALLRQLNERKYHQILVLADDGMRVLGSLDEQAFCTAVMQSPEAKLRVLLTERKQKRPDDTLTV